MSEKETKTMDIAALLAPTVVAMGYQWWGCEFVSEDRRSILRVYIDDPNGIDITACEKVSRQLSAILDVEDPFSGRYMLEVSSPGMDRTLFCLEHYEQYRNHLVKVRLSSPMSGHQQFIGVVSEVKDGNMVLTVENGEIHQVPFDNIRRGILLKSREILAASQQKKHSTKSKS